jgi:ATP-dependent DNA helicase RecG
VINLQTNELVQLAQKIAKSKSESQTIETKAAKVDCPKHLYDTLSSFSNQNGGGTIVFGIDESDNWNICGVYNAHDLQKKVTEQCNQMEPVCRPLFTVAEIDDKTIVSAEIPEIDYADRPCFYKGKGVTKGAYIRVGDNDSPMTPYEIYRYESFRAQQKDDERTPKYHGKLWNKAAVNEFVNAVKKGKENLTLIDDDNIILDLIGVMRDGNPTLSGILLFDKFPQSTFPQLCVTAVVIAGEHMGDIGENNERFISNKRIEGNFEQVLEQTEAFIYRNMKTATIIDESGKRNDKSEYPQKAVREAVLNAMMHRDYSVYTENSPIRVEMYSDRLEITNPGGLYGRITIDELGKVKTIVRNATLVNMLEILNIAENRHSGVPTIINEMAAAKLPSPVFEDKRGNFKVTFYNSQRKIDENTIKILEFCKTPRSRGEIAEFVGKTPYWTTESIIKPLIGKGALKLTLPDKVKSKNQKYYSAES